MVRGDGGRILGIGGEKMEGGRLAIGRGMEIPAAAPEPRAVSGGGRTAVAVRPGRGELMGLSLPSQLLKRLSRLGRPRED